MFPLPQPSHCPSPNLLGRAALGCTKLLPLPFGEQAACLAGAYRAPPPAHLALEGFHPMVCKGGFQTLHRATHRLRQS